VPPPPTTAHGALLAHITGGHVGLLLHAAGSARSYQPMNVNFGLFPPLAHALKGEHGQRLRGTDKTLAKSALVHRARPRRSCEHGSAATLTPSRRNGPMSLAARHRERWTRAVVLKRDPLSTVERGRFDSGSRRRRGGAAPHR
jgi:hypothetical protein